jgi:hypothetical protein
MKSAPAFNLIVLKPIAALAMVFADQTTGISYASIEPFYEGKVQEGNFVVSLIQHKLQNYLLSCYAAVTSPRITSGGFD